MKRTKSTKRVLGRTFIREWRKYRGLTQEKLADLLEISHTTLGRIELSKVPYNQEFLEACAEALRCAPADLLTRDPRDPEGIWSLWQGLSPPQRRQLIAVAAALKTTSTAA